MWKDWKRKNQSVPNVFRGHRVRPPHILGTCQGSIYYPVASSLDARYGEMIDCINGKTRFNWHHGTYLAWTNLWMSTDLGYQVGTLGI